MGMFDPMLHEIEDFALIGDLHTAALVERGGGIDWLCVPRFDSDAVFAGLLGTPENGTWSLGPVDAPRSTKRRYRDDTLVLETIVEAEGGSVRVIDFMPRREDVPTIVRIVEGIEGRVEMQTRLVCRFQNGQLPPWTRWIGNALTMTVGGDAVALHASVPVEIDVPDAYARFTAAAGDRATFVLQWYPSHTDPPDARDALEALAETETLWREWSAQCTYQGEYRDVVMRSLVTLKALTYDPTGGSVAAVTTSLPEDIGGSKNWDYRYAWLRDSAFTIDALVAGGYHEEAQAWRDWLLRMLAGSPEKLQIMYSVSGDRRIEEYTLDLAGYQFSKPVRIGNAAYQQFQLGIYGETMNAIVTAHRAGIEIDAPAWEMLRILLDYVCDHWHEPDSGIWETRGEPEHFTNSRMQAWVAFDRAIEVMEADGYNGPLERWKKTRAAIHENVCVHGFSPSRGAFVRSYESHDLDASVLLMPIVGFLPASDERVKSTVRAIESELMVDGFIMRKSNDIEATPFGRPKIKEGAFLACNLWLVQNYVLAGRTAEARALFKRILDVSNDVGLLSEEYDVYRKRLVGNFPQTFSHATLVNTAILLARE